MRRLVLLLLVSAACLGCAMLPWNDDNTGLVCQRGVEPGGVNKDNVDPLAAGEPLEGVDVMSMSPEAVGTTAVERGLAVTWRFQYDIGDASGQRGYSECWCVAPSDGRVTQVLYDSTGGLIVFVDAGFVLPGPRPQPRLGWGCDQTVASVAATG